MGRVSVMLIVITAMCMVNSSPLNQEQLDTLANTMRIKVKNLYNLRDNAKTHTVRLYIKNDGGDIIPSSGWRLYFHSMYLLYPEIFPQNKSVELELEHIQVGMVQGDLYYLEPSTGFIRIPPGGEREYDLIAQFWMISRTDFMPLWYVVSEDANITPRVIKSAESLKLDFVEPYDDVRQWKRFAADRYNPYTAQERLRRYKTTDKRKVEKIVIPTPKHVEVNEEATIPHVDDTWRIFVAESAYNQVGLYLSNILQLKNVTNLPSAKVIILDTTDNPSSDESYYLQIDPANRKIHLKSKNENGIFYAAISLWSIMDGYKRKNIPDIKIIDEPRYHFRGMHVDVARNFHNLHDMKRILSAMAMYKMNKIHLHLSDDEGWRLEIPGIPELTEIGGRRCHDHNNRKCIIPQFGSGPFNTSSGSGYFTTDDYKELLRYAKERHIEVIPEFDMPGHAHAAIFAMEERYRKYHEAGNESEALKYRLSDPDDKSKYLSVQQWFDNAINPCVDSVYTFIGKVIDEVIALHKDIQPLDIYHFGGDEVAHFAWEESPKCGEFIIENPKYNVTKGIKIYFVERVAKLAAERNISLCGWEDGFADGSHDPINQTYLETDINYAISWNSIWEWGGGEQSYKLANAGFKVILAQATNIYFDHPQEPDPEERGLYWATRFTDILKVLKFMPDSLYENIFEERSGKKITKTDICGENSQKCEKLERKENIIGMEGAMFSETIRTSENVDYMIFPRLVALAERAWYKADFEDESISEEEREDLFSYEWEKFANTVGYKELQRLDNAGIKYRVPPPGARVTNDGEVIISTVFPGLKAQISNNKGITWSNISSVNTLEWQNGDSSIHLRTVSANGMRYSRVVELFKDEPRDWSDQSLIDYIADNVELQLEVISNFEKTEDGYVPLELKLRNSGDRDIPRGTWKLYFYSLYGAKVESLTCGLTLKHEIGSLYYFTPEVTGFSNIAAGDLLRCRYHNRKWMIARFNNMPNWFVTSLGMTAKVIKSTASESIDYVGKFDGPEKWKRAKNDMYDPYTPATRYDLYRSPESRQQKYKIVPTPLNTTMMSELIVFTASEWRIKQSSAFQFEVEYLAEKMNMTIVATGQSKIVTFVNKSPSENDPEAYDLDINAKTSTITITADSSAGAFYGVQSLISLFDGNDGNLVHMSIKDRPRFQYRGVMIDTARNFKSKEWILNFLDLMSVYKLNKFHFHLTDDEGWRLEIPTIPELTQVGGKRCYSDYKGVCTKPQYGSGPDIDTHGTGFYSVQDYIDILKYANERHIEVIPEIETPGHATAAIISMEYRELQILKMKEHGNKNLPESFLLSENFNREVISPLKWPRNAMDPCLNTTYKFVETVVDGLIKIHRDAQPLKVIHLGGDEVPDGVWSDSKACLNMFQPGKQIQTDQLKRLFLQRIADIVASKGLTLASWDDGMYADNKPNPISDYKSEVHVYTWDNRGAQVKRVSEFANHGYKVVLPVASHLYFDHPQEPDPEERGPQWAARFIDTEKVFSLLPDDLYANFNVDQFGNKIDMNKICGNKACPVVNKTENILGLQACLFSETIRTEEQSNNMVFPRLLALAERAWHKASWETSNDVNERNAEREQDWKTFSDNLGYKELSRLDKHGTNYRISPPGAKIENGILKVNTEYANLLVECSNDNGKSWNVYRENKIDPGTTLLLRSRSNTSNVTSRYIELSNPTVSDAVHLPRHFSLVLILVGFICNFLTK